MTPRRPRLISATTPLALLGIIVLGTVIYLSGRVLRDPTTAPIVKHDVAPPVHWSNDFQGRIAQMTQLVEALKLPVPLPTPSTEAQGAGNLRWTHRRYDIELPKPARPDDFEKLLAPLKNMPPDVSVHDVDDGTAKQLVIGIDGLLTHTLSFHWRQRSPRVAIIIDGLGDDLLLARDLAALPAPLTFAVKPLRPFSTAVAERAHLAGREVLVSLAFDSEASKPEPTFHTGYQDPVQDALIQRLDQSLDAVPQAHGASAGMTARFAQDRESVRHVLEHLKQKNIFLIDTAAESPSAACTEAQPVHEPCASDTTRLDDSADTLALRKQLVMVRERALQRGDIIVSVRARQDVLEALRAELADFASQQVDIVPVSETLPPTALSHP
ncbi:MAG: divergent polysaccharide deacetylase family protein [Deltaproteobacteria bacterium]|nr:divergent polysaccharide deacetylase family protein [Deltaproteobacteria bacterium]